VLVGLWVRLSLARDAITGPLAFAAQTPQAMLLLVQAKGSTVLLYESSGSARGLGLRSWSGLMLLVRRLGRAEGMIRPDYLSKPFASEIRLTRTPLIQKSWHSRQLSIMANVLNRTG